MNDRLLADLADIIRSVARVSADVELGAETRLIEDLSIDSLDLVGIILKIQDDHGVSIDEDDVPTLTTLGSLAAYVENRRGAAAA